MPAKGQTGTSSTRALSASEVARNIKHFDAWSLFHGCEEVAFSDVPFELEDDVQFVFDAKGKLPASWVDRSSKCYSRIKKLQPQLLELLKRANKENPSLFSKELSTESCEDLLSELSCVLLAWKKLQWMRRNNERWSEADFAANVYNILRSTAVHESSYRTQCGISLPAHLSGLTPALPSSRVLSARTVVPDSSMFITSSSLRTLSKSKSSPYKALAAHPSTKTACSHILESGFKYQATPCSQPTEHACFEFSGCVMEDKKNGIDLEHAYRQNRMATASLVRHLHSLRIRSPVFGLVWADGRVRAHVDWWCAEGENLSVQSAPYPPSTLDEQSIIEPDSDEDDHGSIPAPIFHEWNLERPGDIISTYLVLRNIDAWTSGRFRQRVQEGVEALVHAVTHDNAKYKPWKRVDPPPPAAKPVKSRPRVENTPPPPPNNTGFPTPPPGPKRKVPKLPRPPFAQKN
ncbi:hypothetical protein SCHPADRAFT_902769 [Schizopora paradoxa]|uniref:Uncharacterized protein n=1 Tax=Schizopora paradoxa TaxID=27342 RepID=A0A0H2RTA9_9AGAM|nr:hypothetical protein SCHPADRAFT_902769 [Schizopora paradoxa]